MEPFTGGSALASVKAVAIGAAVSLLVVSGLARDGSGHASRTPASRTVVQQVLDRTQADARCSRLGSRHAGAGTGTGTGTEEATALVRRPSGALAVVSFTQAWAVYTHQAPGTFVSLCVGRQRAGS